MATPSGAECEAPSWDALHLFPLRAERIVVARWYWLVGGPVLLWLAIAAYMMGKPNPWGGRFELAWFLSDPYLLILIGGLFCGGIVFMPWERTLRRLVPSLRDRGVVRGESPEQTRVAEYQLFADFCRWLGSPWRYAFIATFIAFTVVASIAFGMHKVIFNWWEWAQSTRRSDYFVAIFIGSQVLTFFLWSYAAGSATWCFVSSARLLRELPRRFRISVVWGHPDNCGGFREIGSCCLGMAGPLVIAGAVLALWLLVPDTDRLTYAIACVALVAVVLPMTVVVFIVPLWAIHRAMAKCRQLYIDAYSQRYDSMLRRLDASIGTADEAALKQLTSSIEAHRLLDPDAIRFPAWPFDRRIVAKLALPQVAAALAAATKLVGFIR